jgi:uncharacterized membrane protein
MHSIDRSAARRQGGSVVINATIALSLLLIVLVGTDLGYLFFMKRQYQKAADLAALAGAPKLNGPAGCQLAKDAARLNANGSGANDPLRNLPPNISLEEADITCGRWDPAFTSNASHFDSTDPNHNAIRVSFSRTPDAILSIFSGNRTIGVQAIAAKASDPVASFSVGSGVARLDDGALNRVLTMLLGTGVDLSLIDYTGLADAKVNLLGLAEALDLGLGSYDELIAANISLSDLITAAITALPQSNDSATATLVAELLQGLLSLDGGLDLDRTTINLLKTAKQAGLITVDLDTKNPRSALNGDISALNLLLVSLQVANSDAGAAAELELPLNPLANVKVKTTVIEPPSIAIGPPGYYPGGKARTSAHTGQVRLFLDAKVLTPAAGGDLLNFSLLGLASVKLSLPAGQLINLPIYAEVASGDGELEAVACKVDGAKHDVAIGVTPGLAHVFVGKMPTAFTNRDTKWSDLAKERFDLLSVKAEVKLLFGLLPVVDAPIGLKAKVDLPVSQPTRTSTTFRFDPQTPVAKQNLLASVGSEQHLGAAIAGAIKGGALDVELDTSGLKILGLDASGLSQLVDGLVNRLAAIVKGVLSLVGAVLDPVLSLLDGAVLGPLLRTLGLQLGFADVQLLSASCDGGAKLVY